MFKRQAISNSDLQHLIYMIADDAIANDQVSHTKIGISEKDDKVFVLEITYNDKHIKEDGETYNEISCEDITAFDEEESTAFVDANEVKRILKELGFKIIK